VRRLRTERDPGVATGTGGGSTCRVVANLSVLGMGVFLALGLGFSGGCFGSGHAPSQRYYSLPISLGLKEQPKRFDFVVRVEEFDVVPAYDRHRLVYRLSPYEFRYYGFRQWGTKPGRLVADSFRAYLRHSGLFADVTEGPAPTPRYTVTGKVIAIEEQDYGPKVGQKQWYAHLSLVVEVGRIADGKVVWRTMTDRRVPLAKKRPKAMVAGMTILLRQVAARLLSGIVRQADADRERGK